MPKFPSASPSPIQFFQDDGLYAPTDPALGRIATESTLRFWRHKGRGPNFHKSEGARGRIWYSGRDLNLYLDKCRVEIAA